MKEPARELHPLIRWDLERRQAAGEEHRRRRRELARFTQPVGVEPELPDQPLTNEERIFLFMQWAACQIELREYVGEGEYEPRDVESVVTELLELRDRWLEVRGAEERGEWEPLLADRYVRVFASMLVRRSGESA